MVNGHDQTNVDKRDNQCHMINIYYEETDSLVAKIVIPEKFNLKFYFGVFSELSLVYLIVGPGIIW